MVEIPFNAGPIDPEQDVEILSSSPEPAEEGFGAKEQTSGSQISGAEAEEWKQKHDEIKDRLVWMAADFDNYKKRVLKEKEEFLKFSQASLLKELLVVVDNLERAMLSMPKDDLDQGFLGLKQGVELTLRQFHSLLGKNGVTKMKVLGEQFDPRFHQVMFQQETTQYPDQTVLEELQSGYMLQERVLRPAMVKVAKNLGSSPTG